ncbi:MAG: cbb3-type cytochrome oxidase assembly protein CcoS [Bacteroidota bacterium]
MSVIVVLIGASLLVAVGFLIAFLWAVKSGQYDDKYTPSVRILFENNVKVHDTSHKVERANLDA